MKSHFFRSHVLNCCCLWLCAWTTVVRIRVCVFFFANKWRLSMENKQRNIYAHIIRIRHHKKTAEKKKETKMISLVLFFSFIFLLHSFIEWMIHSINRGNNVKEQSSTHLVLRSPCLNALSASREMKKRSVDFCCCCCCCCHFVHSLIVVLLSLFFILATFSFSISLGRVSEFYCGTLNIHIVGILFTIISLPLALTLWFSLCLLLSSIRYCPLSAWCSLSIGVTWLFCSSAMFRSILMEYTSKCSHNHCHRHQYHR